MLTIWQQGSTNPENPHHLATIRQWWQELNGKEIFWQQRLLPPSKVVDDINWEAVRFDEFFVVSNPQLRGITLYWYKSNSSEERSTTPHKLILDSLHSSLYIFPQSQKELVIKVALPSLVYQTITVTNPEWEYQAKGENQTLTIRDASQKIEVIVSLSPENMKQLMRQLLKQDKV